MKHIPTRHFSDTIDLFDRIEIMNKYESVEWDVAKRLLSETRRITMSAVRVAEVMKAKLDIDLFPCIHKAASRGWGMDGGSCAFWMMNDRGKVYMFFERASRMKSMSARYSIDNDSIYRES